MKNVIHALIYIHVAIVGCVATYYLARALSEPPPAKRNVCMVAEISPDVTPEERKHCRLIRGHKL